MIEFSRAQVPPCAGDAKGRARALLLVANEPIRGLGQSFLAFGDAGRSQPYLRPGRRLPKFLEAGNAGSRYQVCLLWSGLQARIPVATHIVMNDTRATPACSSSALPAYHDPKMARSVAAGTTTRSTIRPAKWCSRPEPLRHISVSNEGAGSPLVIHHEAPPVPTESIAKGSA